MATRKRGRLQEDDDIPDRPFAPSRATASSADTLEDPIHTRVLAPREMFFSIPLRTIAVQQDSILPLAEPQGEHAQADARVKATPNLNNLQRASLIAILTLLQDYFPSDDITQKFTRSLANVSETTDATLASIADRIDMGLIAFLAKGGQHDYPTTIPSVTQPSFDGVSATVTTSPVTSATATPSNAAKTNTQKSQASGRTTRSQKVKKACRARDGQQCRLCNADETVSAHIIPFSIYGSKNLNFWSFVSMFRGIAATVALKAAALDPSPEDMDNIMNVMQLCNNCHRLFDKPHVSLVPRILEDSSIIFPYDPRVVHHYDVVAEFPNGFRAAKIAIFDDDGDVMRMRAGHILTFRTPDPINLPLPHPLLLQLHVVCSRLVVMRAAAGYPVLGHDDCDGDTLYDLCDVEDVIEDDGDEGRLGEEDYGTEKSRDPEIVVLELEQRKHEWEQLFKKRRGMGWVMSSWESA